MKDYYFSFYYLRTLVSKLFQNIARGQDRGPQAAEGETGGGEESHGTEARGRAPSLRK